MAKPGFLEHIHPPRIPPERTRFSATFCLGGLSFLLFLVLGGTGVVLMFSYVPTPQGAAAFFAQEAGDLPFAWFFRRLHFLAGQAMVITLLLHLARVLAARAYLPPRAANWLVGLGLLLLTLALDLSGYVLRWDAATQGAATVAAGVLGEIPAVGPLFKSLLLGGPSLGEASLLRFYVLHCLALPAFTLVLSFYHFWRIRKDGRPTSGL
ncbi:MAG: cytochrome b N-terminal domain-containing protein [Desulfarculus sp.]|nr:cytochrome b N-terminal domain-containing protein [Pseudomonadota bacterium]MBU4600299.1 cytochrome b N-terminal domain-containing protein [Pseudomonadota bacterium]MBV1714758.1 cytochrome b N-terminal domain-containing protein [Desulfarculus sp.]MBV1740246.1 cytochrome b N-terminal domain-containing protein [Desulfarculus sp.]